MSSDYVTVTGTLVFQRERSAYWRIEGVVDPKYKGQFIPKMQTLDVDWDDDNLTQVEFRVKRYYYKQHIGWRIYGVASPNRRTT